MSPIPIHVVTGFLGAGKTSLINRLLRAPEFADTFVIVNEFGEVGLDHLLYETLAGDIVLLASGCLCCELRGDLVDTLQHALVRRDAGELAFARVVLETSGLADPAPILHALLGDPTLSRGFRLAGVTTLVDAVNGVESLARHGEARRQIALADRIAITKSDLAPTAALLAAVASINPTAPVVDAGELDATRFLAEPEMLISSTRATAMSTHGDARARCFVTAMPIEAAALARFLELLQAALGPGLLRIKGLVNTRETPGRPLLVEAVQHAFPAPVWLERWPPGPQETRLVVITDGVADEKVDRLWSALTGEPRIDQSDLAGLWDNPLAPRRGGLLA